MDVSVINLVALGIVFITQIILIAQVSDLKKKRTIERNSGNRSNRPDHRSKDQRNKPRIQNNRKEKQSAPSSKINSVDKSLRDINLRLKSAERDQEKSRQELIGDDSGKTNGKNNFPKNNNRRRNNRPNNKRQQNPNRNQNDLPGNNMGLEHLPPGPPIIKDKVHKDVSLDEVIQHGRQISSSRRKNNEGNTNNSANSANEKKRPDSPESASTQNAQDVSFGRR